MRPSGIEQVQLSRRWRVSRLRALCGRQALGEGLDFFQGGLRSSAISAARTAGGGRSSVLVRLSSRSQKMSRLTLSRAVRLVVGEALEALGLLATVEFAGPVARHEVVEVGALQWALLAGEVLVGAQVVDPQLAGPGLLGASRRRKKRTLAFTPWA